MFSANPVTLLHKIVYIVLQSLARAKQYLLQKIEFQYAELAFIFTTCLKKNGFKERRKVLRTWYLLVNYYLRAFREVLSLAGGSNSA